MLLAGLALPCGLAVLELGIRLFRPEYDPSGHLKLEAATPIRPALGRAGTVQWHIKNTGAFAVPVRFNQYGFRDRRDLRDSNPADIAVVGDSFSFGWGVNEEERFSDRLEELIGVHVFNIAMPGARLADYGRLLDYAERTGLRAKRLVVGICMENDLAPPPAIAGAAAAPPSPLLGAHAWLKSRSAAYFLLLCRVHQNASWSDRLARWGWITPVLEGVPRAVGRPDVIRSSAEQLEGLVRNHDATILIIPSRALWVGDDRDAADRMHRDWVATLREKNLPVVDLRMAMEESGNPMGFHFRGDGHWNARGHALAARGLSEFLSAK